MENFGPGLVARVAEDAPGVRLRFVQKVDKDREPLRGGAVDLETGVIDETTGPEVRTRALFRDRYIGVVRIGHALSRGKVTPARYSSGKHILVSRQSLAPGPMDEALKPLGLERRIVTIVGGFAAALVLARASDLVATVPERHTGHLRAGMHSFRLPVSVLGFTISMLWHPRMDADIAHRWLRACIHEVCQRQLGDDPQTR